MSENENDRIQVFTAEGRFVAQWKDPAMGRPYGVRIGKDGRLYVADGGEQPSTPPNRSGLAVITLEGKARRLGSPRTSGGGHATSGVATG